MELCTGGTRFARHSSVSSLAPYDIAHAGSALGLGDLVSGPMLQRAADAPIALNGLRLHCDGAPALKATAQQSATERLLSSLAQGLCAPFRSHDDYILELSEVETDIAAVDSPGRIAAGSLVQYAYGLRYLGVSGEATEELDDEQLERAGEASTVVALAQQRGVPQVIGTLRFIVGERLSMFDFFAPEPGTRWPQGSAAPAEYTRLAFHPVFDRMGRATGGLQRDLTRFYKLLVLRKLVSRCTAEILDQGARVIYFIAAPHVVRVLVASGLRLEPLRGALAIESDFSRSVRNAFPRYWRPEQAEQQPIPYLLSTDLNEVTVPIGHHRIVIAPDNSLRLAAMDEARLASAAA